MKFPLSQAPFGEYPSLSEAQTEQIELIVQQTLSETLAEYESHQKKQRRLLPRSQYKVVKKVENLICYRQRSGATPEVVTPAAPVQTNSSAPASSAASASYAHVASNEDGESIWRIPKLVTIGTMAGTLDDVMYGLLATDATSTFIRASYTNEELLDSELLHCIQSPTPDKPFQFCGVKWHVLELSKIASKRDFVFVEASGVVDRPNGERVGYHIMHSIDLPGLGELSDKYQVLRARVVSCHLFRQLSNNTVDVYMKGLVDPSGHMPGAVAIASTAGALLKLGQAMECSHSKKLEYLLEQEQIKRAGSLNRTSGANHTSGRSSGSAKSTKAIGFSKPCAVCATTLHLFRSVANCELCSEAVCSRCRVTRRLSYRVARPKELKQQNTIFCTTCVAKTSTYSAADVARSELAAQSSPKKKLPNSLNNLVSSQLRRFLTNSTFSSNNTALSSSNYSRLETPVEEDEEDLSSRRRSLSIDGVTVQVRRRSVTHPPVKAETLVDLDLTSLSIVSTSSDYLDEDFYESEAGRRKTQPPSAFSDLPECEPVDPLASSMPPKPSGSTMNSQLRRQRELMQRMEELRQTAENVYQFTRMNTQSMHCGGAPLPQSVCVTASNVDIVDLD